MTGTKTLTHFVAAAALVLSGVGVATAAITGTAGAAAPYYSSCDNLHQDWPKGVAKSRRAAAKQVRQGNKRPAYGPRARKIYWENHSRLDADDDGTACEVANGAG